MGLKKFWTDLARRVSPAVADVLLIGNSVSGEAQYMPIDDLPASKAIIAYINQAISGLKNSGIITGSFAGSVMPWFGPDSTIPADWAKIGNVAVWLLKADYPELYAALGGENNPFGVNATQFCLPWIPAGHSLVQTGAGYALAATGGAEKVQLKEGQLPKTRVKIGSRDSTAGFGTDSNSEFVDDYGYNGTGAGQAKYSSYFGNDEEHDNMSPWLGANWIIKLTNSGGTLSATIDSNGHLILSLSDGTTQDCGSVWDPDAVKYTAQTKTTAEKQQARTNIEAAAQSDLTQEISDRQSADTQIIDGATGNGDTLRKLENRLVAAEAIIGSAAGDSDNVVDTVRELLAVFANMPEGVDIVNALAGKVNTSDIYNALDCIISGKALDARQGKVLNDAITTLSNAVSTLQSKTAVTEISDCDQALTPGPYSLVGAKLQLACRLK